jgi:putative transposase
MSNALQFIIFLAAGWVNRQQQDLIDYLKEENKVLREQLGGRRLHLTDDQRRRLALKGQALGRAILAQVAGIVTPDTILRWYQKLIARKYDGSSKRGPGRPRTEQELAALVVRIARENPTWGYTRLRGAMRHLGHELGRSTIRRLLKEHGITPAPERGSRMPWKTFLKAHWPALAAADFFNVEVLTISGLVRYWVLFVIALETRRVEIVGISPAPDAAWMQQLGRNLTDPGEGFLSGKGQVILDHDPETGEACSRNSTE